jgi:putative transposase
MRRMGIEALYRRPRTTTPEPGHKIYPYLLRGIEITRPNQVWAMDITYIPMARGFVYLAVVLDWFSRRVLSWRLSITMDSSFCVEALEDALARYGKPDIFNTDQGSQFTAAAFTGVLAEKGITISMDGRLAGQRIRRTSVAKRQIRRGVPAGLRERLRCPHVNRTVSRLLQSRIRTPILLCD